MKKKTIRLLRGFLEKHGEEAYNKLVTQFPACGEACGYSLDEIKNFDIEMIRYPKSLKNKVVQDRNRGRS